MAQPTYKAPPGYLGNLTPEQQTKLDQFRQDLSTDPNFPWTPARHDDATLLRFLRARKFDLVASRTMIVAAEQWRKDFGVEEIVKDFQFVEHGEVSKHYPRYYHKTDKDGRPVYIEVLPTPAGLTALFGADQVKASDRLVKRLVQEYERSLTERLPAASAEVGHPVGTFCTILDLKNASMSSFWGVSKLVQQASSIGQNYYPETMGKFYIINTGFVFSTIWSVIKGWLDPVTVEKIHVLKSGTHPPELLKQIDANNLPVEFGGKCQCPGGCSMSDEGPWKHPKQASTSGEPATA